MKTNKIIAVCLLMATLLACNAVTQAPQLLPTATLEQIPTSVPAATAAPLYQQVTLTGSKAMEEGKTPDYTVETEMPVLQGSDDPRVANFNQAVAAIVSGQIAGFKKNLIDWTPSPVTNLSTFFQTYELISPVGNVISLQIKIEYYMAGAAHPAHQTISYSYDLEKGQEITLNQLFLPNANALPTIADYCKAELGKRDIAFDAFSNGADPIAENYTVWNISTAGLVILFNEYQVAPYAAGPQTVILPRDVLGAVIDPSGPLAQAKP